MPNYILCNLRHAILGFTRATRPLSCFEDERPVHRLERADLDDA